jgi:hypothetical protein
MKKGSQGKGAENPGRPVITFQGILKRFDGLVQESEAIGSRNPCASQVPRFAVLGDANE